MLSKAAKGMAVDPLTNLPGKHQIYEETRKRLERRGKFFAFMYVDISNLLAVNCMYGVDRGDQVILGLANILREIVKADEEFLGYMGEDDFVILSVPLRVKQIFGSLTSRFDATMADVCPEAVQEASTSPEQQVTLAVAVVTNERKQFGDPLQIKNVALEVLKQARNSPGHSCADLKDFPL